MKKIDRYILQKFYSTFFYCLLLFTLIVVVVDMSEKTEDFARSGLSASQIFYDYYLGFIPHIDAMLFPLFVFISVIFFTSKMAGRSEVIAILSSGVSFRRYLQPFFIGGLSLALMLWMGYQYLIPRANEKRGNFEKKYTNLNAAPSPTRSSYKQNIYFRLDSITYATIKGYDTISKTGTNLYINQFKNNKLVYNLRAMNFHWDTASKKWKLITVTERAIDSITEKVTLSPTKLTSFSFKPIDLRKDDYLKDQMSTPELKRFIAMEKMRLSEMLSTLEVEKHNRDAIPASVVILTLIGAILASQKVRGGSGYHLALGVIVSVSYILFSRFAVVFATRGNFTPWLASWTPNIIFGLLTFYLYKKSPK
jgi:lipopolysaccharide export system permease protein